MPTYSEFEKEKMTPQEIYWRCDECWRYGYGNCDKCALKRPSITVNTTGTTATTENE